MKPEPSLDCYTFQASERIGRIYACSRAAYPAFRAKHKEKQDFPETCPSSHLRAKEVITKEVTKSDAARSASPEAGAGTCLVPLLRPNKIASGGGSPEEKSYLFVLDDIDDLWSWALLPSRLGNLVAEKQFLLSGVEESSPRHRAVLAWALATYAFERFRTQRSPSPLQLVLEEGDRACAEEAYILCHGRDLINTPANVLGAEGCEQEVRSIVEQRGGNMHAICGEALVQENYPLIHAVGRSAREQPRLLEVRWDAPECASTRTSGSKVKSLALVGKGVCFDSGGLNVKDARSMRLMKKDMGGLAHALALALLLRARKAPLDLRLLLPVAENAVSRDAMRPSDIYASRKGDTVEIGHTDAEGRLLLADALWEASAPCSRSGDGASSCTSLPAAVAPDLVVDVATLTGAARVATGPQLPNMFANDDALAEQLLECARQVQDPLWRMPLWQDYRHALRSPVADLSSSGSWPYAGSITAALFLQNFVASGMMWIHLDVMAWNERTRAGRPEGGELQGVRALATFLDAWSRDV